MQAFSITLSLPRGKQKGRLRRVTSSENNGVRKHRAHWLPSLVLEAGRESSRRESSDVDEDCKGELSGDSESIEPAPDAKTLLSTKPERDGKAGWESNWATLERGLMTWRTCAEARLIGRRRSFDLR